MGRLHCLRITVAAAAVAVSAVVDVVVVVVPVGGGAGWLKVIRGNGRSAARRLDSMLPNGPPAPYTTAQLKLLMLLLPNKEVVVVHLLVASPSFYTFSSCVVAHYRALKSLNL